MTPEQRRRVEEIFDQLAGVPSERHRLMLDQLCHDDDPLIRAEVESLLKAQAATLDPAAELPSSTQQIRDVFEGLAGVVPVSPADPLLGTLIGVYHIIEKVGEGGMGAVYRARQTSPVK